MPPVGAAIAAIGASIWAGVTAFAATAFGSFVVQLAFSFAVSAVMRLLAPKPRGMDQGQQLTTKLDPAYPREVIVGRGATGGSLVYENVSGTNNEYLWDVIALSDNPSEGLVEIVANGETLTFSGDVTTGWRTCTSHFKTDGGDPCLSVRVYLGDESQTADADLVAAFSEITTNFRGRGITYAITKRTYDSNAWQTNSELIFVIDGAKCWDPRLDSGAGDTAFTTNTALIAGQYLRGFSINGVRVVGVGVSADDLPDDDLAAAADECDEAVDLDGGGTEPRYSAGGVINGREAPREILTHLTAAMAGDHVDRGGEIVLLPGVARTAVLDIDEGTLLADAGLMYAPRVTSDDRFNAIVSTYVEPTDGYLEAALPPRENATAITEDGERFETNRAYRFVYSQTQGQRLDEITLRAARKEGFLALNVPLWGFELTPGDWVTMTSKRWGNVSKTWAVETVNLAIINTRTGPRARCALTMRETATSVFSWDETTDELDPIPSGTINQPTPLAALTDENDRINTADGLPLGVMGGIAITRDPSAPLSSSSSSQIDVAAHDVTYSGDVVYELPSAAITGLSTDTNYWVFYDVFGDDYDAHDEATEAATIRNKKLAIYAYILVGTQRTQDGGGGFSPPPPPPPGGGGGAGGGGGGGGDPP